MLLIEYRILDNIKVITEGTTGSKKIKISGRFQKCDEQNNNGRSYPRKILESQVESLRSKINERSLVGALDHPSNDEIRLSQASHLITKLSVEKNGDVIGEAEILSTPAGKIVEALLQDGVKIGISSRGVGTLSEGKDGSKIVNEDFKLITFDLVSDPSTKGAYPELTESAKLNSKKAQEIVKKLRSEQIFLTMLENKLSEGSKRLDEEDSDKVKDAIAMGSVGGGRYNKPSKVGAGKELGVSTMAAKSGKHKVKGGAVAKMPKGQKAPEKAEKPKGKQMKFNFKENTEAIKSLLVKGLARKSKTSNLEKEVLESITNILESTKSDKDRESIKKYLVQNLQSVADCYTYSDEPAKVGDSEEEKSYWRKDANGKLETLERLIAIIKAI